jgi:hypothetical protein
MSFLFLVYGVAQGPFAEAPIVNLALLGVFAVQHRTIGSIGGPSRGLA